jgi:galactokinase
MAHLREQDVADAAGRAFERFSSGPPSGIAFAPGRVNLIGEHTDYNDGFVLPMAIEEGIAAAFGGRSDPVLRVLASEMGYAREIELVELRRGKAAVSGWFRYAAGVAWAMQSAGMPLTGANISIAANLPSGAGLSSSAAFELVIARALTAVAGLTWDPRAAAQLAQRAEHEFAGVACGIMDQMAVACAREGKALLLDCRSLETQDVTLPPAVRVVVMNSGVRRSLAGSAYNERRASCERAVAAVREVHPGVQALRDVDPLLLKRARPFMDETTFRRGESAPAGVRPRARLRRPRRRGARDGGVAHQPSRSLRGVVP